MAEVLTEGLWKELWAPGAQGSKAGFRPLASMSPRLHKRSPLWLERGGGGKGPPKLCLLQRPQPRQSRFIH